jgi:L,D-transpeptidase-like protein
MFAIGARRALTLGMAAAFLACLLIPQSPAEARQRSNYRDRDRSESAAATAPVRKPDGPVNIVISIGSQRLWLYDKHGLITTSIVSTGTGGFPTPTGVFAILDKEVSHHSNIYGGASMPYMQRLTMSGVALHSGHTTGRPASHGCIRLPHAFAIRLFGLTELGARVVVAPNEPTPEEITHPNLFVKKPVQPLSPDEVDPKRAAVAATAIGFDVQKGSATAGVGKITAWRTSMLQALPISVFVSKAEGKVYVRHGFRPLFEAPVQFTDPERPIGTHVYTALEFKEDGTSMRWQALTVPATSAATRQSRKVSRASRNESEPLLPASSGPPSTAAEALGRFELPKEARDRISEMLSPGVTLIVSDHGHNREMRDNGTTDFVVLTR